MAATAHSGSAAQPLPFAYLRLEKPRSKAHSIRKSLHAIASSTIHPLTSPTILLLLTLFNCSFIPDCCLDAPSICFPAVGSLTRRWSAAQLVGAYPPPTVTFFPHIATLEAIVTFSLDTHWPSSTVVRLKSFVRLSERHSPITLTRE